MSTLLDSILSQMDEGTVDQMANHLGVDSGTVQQALPTVLSTILGGLSRNASDPEGAAAIHGAIARDHDGSLLDNLSGLLGGGGLGGLLQGGLGGLLGGGGAAAQGQPDATGGGGALGGLLSQGAGILGHIFGPKQGGVATQVGNATGMDTGTAARLLAMLAPIVMSYLGKLHQQGEIGDSGGLAQILGGAHSQAQQGSLGGILGSILDADHDGSVIDDIGGMLGGLLGNSR